jgi:hypothetical protein
MNNRLAKMTREQEAKYKASLKAMDPNLTDNAADALVLRLQQTPDFKQSVNVATPKRNHKLSNDSRERPIMPADFGHIQQPIFVNNFKSSTIPKHTVYGRPVIELAYNMHYNYDLLLGYYAVRRNMSMTLLYESRRVQQLLGPESQSGEPMVSSITRRERVDKLNNLNKAEEFDARNVTIDIVEQLVKNSDDPKYADDALLRPFAAIPQKQRDGLNCTPDSRYGAAREQLFIKAGQMNPEG